MKNKKEGGNRQENLSAMVDKEQLVDINTVSVDPDAPYEERVRSYLHQIRNPCCYLDHGFIVTCSFTGGRSLEDCMTDYLHKKFEMK